MRDLGSGSAVAQTLTASLRRDVFGCVKSLSWVVPQSGHVHALTLRRACPSASLHPQWSNLRG